MAQSIKYRSLFTVDILHHYFLDKGNKHYESLNAAQKVKQLAFYNVNDFLEIVPTPTCKKALSNHQLVFRNTNKGILVGCKIDPAIDRPYVNIADDTKFTFYIKLKNRNFFNFTTLPLDFRAPLCYYFSNAGKVSDAAKLQLLNLSEIPDVFIEDAAYEAGQVVTNVDESATFFLTQNTDNALEENRLKDTPAPVFNNAADYEKGDVVVETIGGIDQLFEAKEDGAQGTPEDTPGNDWRKILDLPLNYTNNNDLVELVRPLYNYELTSDEIEATAVLSAVTSDGITPVKIDAISETTLYQFDWRKIPSGLYQLEVTDDELGDGDPNKIITEEVFYLNNGTVQPGVLGIIEIYSYRSNDNNFALLQNNGRFQAAKNDFVIRFKNRSTIWRYIFREGQAVAAIDDVSVEDADDKILITTEVKPLTQNGLIPINKGNNQLPNPTTKNIKPETNNIFSEIYL